MKNFSSPAALFRIALLGASVILSLLGNGSPAMAHPKNPLPVIPAPRTWEPAEGAFDPADLRVVTFRPRDGSVGAAAHAAATRLGAVLGRDLPVASDGDPGRLRMRIETGLEPENYRLEIGDEDVVLAAGDADGLHHGVTTLVQLAAHGGPWPRGTVEDGPRFGWRGLLLDCGRHFMPVDVVKGVIDRLAMHKFNVLHWHLTEDQGWRLEIPEYPRLTEVGAWRTNHDGQRYGGFYTAEDVAEVLAYAADRHITVVPEIEMPGHAVAALASSPHLTCTGDTIPVETQWGIHADVYCAGTDEVCTCLETVLTRVMMMFPSAMIHIGGDEVPKNRWRECPKCQARMAAEGLADEDELQSWFIARIEKFLRGHDRRLIGWDEILEGGLAERTDRAVVQAWRGHHHATAAARSGLDVIVSPTSHAYLDYDPVKLPVSRVFAFDPVPDELDGEDRRRVLGGACNLWTEYIPPARVDTMLFPRLAAMSEALWTADPGRDFQDFHTRWLGHGPVMEHLGAVAGPGARPLTITGRYQDGRYRFEVEIDDETREAFDGHDLEIASGMAAPAANGDPAARPEDRQLPDLPPGSGEGRRWEIAMDPADPPLAAQARLTIDGLPYGAPAVLEVHPHRALARDPVLVHEASRRYPASLTDGIHGGRDHRDGRWAGFEFVDLDATLDLGEAVTLQTVSARFLQDANAWILLPRTVAVAWSADGEDWHDVATQGHDVPDRVQDPVIREFRFDLAGTDARFIRLQAANFGPLPDWHPGRGQKAWIFVDEIVVR